MEKEEKGVAKLGLLDFLRRRSYRLVALQPSGGWQKVSDYANRIAPDQVDLTTLDVPPGSLCALQELDHRGILRRFVWKEILIPAGAIERAPPREREASLEEAIEEFSARVTKEMNIMTDFVKAGKALAEAFGGGASNPPEENLDEVLSKRLDQLKKIKETFSTHGVSTIEPPKFTGEAPWIAHPYFVNEIGETIMKVSDHVADRFGVPRPAEAAAPVPPPEGAELPELPQPEAYMPTPPVAPPAPVVVSAPVEVKVKPPEKVEEEAPLEEEEEGVPSEEEAPQGELEREPEE